MNRTPGKFLAVFIVLANLCRAAMPAPAGLDPRAADGCLRSSLAQDSVSAVATVCSNLPACMKLLADAACVATQFSRTAPRTPADGRNAPVSSKQAEAVCGQGIAVQALASRIAAPVAGWGGAALHGMRADPGANAGNRFLEFLNFLCMIFCFRKCIFMLPRGSIDGIALFSLPMGTRADPDLEPNRIRVFSLYGACA